MPEEVKKVEEQQPAAPQAPAQAQPPAEPKGLEAMVKEKPELLKELYAKSPELFKDLAEQKKEPEQKKVEPAVEDQPEEISLKLPEGMNPEEESLKAFKKIMGDKKMTSGQKAQAVVDMQARIMAEAQKASAAARAAEEKALKDAFGADYEAGMELAKKGLVYAEKESPGLVKKLEESGLGKDPAIIRHFHALGKSTSEARTPRPPQSVPGAQDEEEALRKRFYNSPGMFPQRNPQQ